MIEFLNRLFGRHGSGAMAKERLRLVLMSDHLSLAPEMVEAMKREFVDVISRYVEVDRDKIDVHFEHQDTALAMLANIPILAVNRNGGAKKQDEAAAAARAQPKARPEASKGEASKDEAPKGTSPPRPKRKRRKATPKSVPQSAAGAPAAT